MKKITKAEKEYISKHSPKSVISIASKNKNSRGKTYFVEETKITENLLKDYNVGKEL